MPTPEEIKAAEEKAKSDATAKEIADLKAKNAEYEAKLADLSKKKTEDDPELITKAKETRDAKDKKEGDTRALENALKFNLKSEEFLKTNASLLPKDVADIFKQAETEKYSDAIEKDGAIKSGIIQSFFKVQANLDLLTPALKTNLDEYLALTKNGKQEGAQKIYDTIFEPTFEMLKKLRKAEALSKGHGEGDDAYKNRLMAGSQKHFFGGNTNVT